MPVFTLETGDQAVLASALAHNRWIVACLCAAWCDVCTAYRPVFNALAEHHPDKHFVWIDIEDYADIVGDFDVENFPTLLMQRGDVVAFYGSIPPDAHVTVRIVSSQAVKNNVELATEARGTAERQSWQQHANLVRAIGKARGDLQNDS